MIGLSYASVPLYRMFCQATGYGGAVGRSNIEDKVQKWQQAAGTDLEKRAAQRELRVWFSGDVAEDLPWKFTPAQDFVTVHPGQSTLAFFTAENRR
jgi:cytochrome c oxidase assembly protein subunit 11